LVDYNHLKKKITYITFLNDHSRKEQLKSINCSRQNVKKSQLYKKTVNSFPYLFVMYRVPPVNPYLDCAA